MQGLSMRAPPAAPVAPADAPLGRAAPSAAELDAERRSLKRELRGIEERIAAAKAAGDDGGVKALKKAQRPLYERYKNAKAALGGGGGGEP
jgi:hypothetical protein